MLGIYKIKGVLGLVVEQLHSREHLRNQIDHFLASIVRCRKCEAVGIAKA